MSSGQPKKDTAIKDPSKQLWWEHTKKRVIHVDVMIQNQEKVSLAAKLLREIQVILMLLLHFKEDENKVFIKVENTCVLVEVRREALPPTPCNIMQPVKSLV